jgi:hypothetical protein
MFDLGVLLHQFVPFSGPATLELLPLGRRLATAGFGWELTG